MKHFEIDQKVFFDGTVNPRELQGATGGATGGEACGDGKVGREGARRMSHEMYGPNSNEPSKASISNNQLVVFQGSGNVSKSGCRSVILHSIFTALRIGLYVDVVEVAELIGLDSSP
jgi:hypothetical protein